MNSNIVIDSIRSLHDLTKAINSTLDIKEVVEVIMKQASTLMKAERVVVLTLDSAKKDLSVYNSLGFADDKPQVALLRNTIAFDRCIVHKGRVIEMKELIPEDDYNELLCAAPELSDMVFAPLEIRGEAYGLLGVSDKKKNFSEMELEIFCALASHSAVALENANLYKKLKDTFVHTAHALAEAINSRDPYTGGHTKRVAEYSLELARALGLTEKEKEKLRLAAVLHDIGKIGIDDAILRKGGSLSHGEEESMRKHPEIGAKILGFVEEMREVVPAILYHHEKLDGTGYPAGLKGEGIPLHAKIIAIADTFDALTTDRPYRDALDKRSALAELNVKAGTHFDPYLVDIFCKTILEKAAAKE
ncbi:Metal dependent phosphohydrolase, HD region [hydrothermal vent metagenome]|uniref:Metal dependent phosphohydrolase, HD region n=1 Tax=hydrothermal vent metagenome TaxID=652676 RepID=A0A3B0QY64_9ZZZZ